MTARKIRKIVDWKEVEAKFDLTIPCPTVRDVKILAKRILGISNIGLGCDTIGQLSLLANLMLPDAVLDKPIVDFALLRQEKAKAAKKGKQSR